MANLKGVSYSVSQNSKNYVAVPTKATRARGMFWRRYSNNTGQWCYPDGPKRRYPTHDPRKLPVPLGVYKC